MSGWMKAFQRTKDGLDAKLVSPTDRQTGRWRLGRSTFGSENARPASTLIVGSTKSTLHRTLFKTYTGLGH
jgi:hypothetical protein